MSNKNDDLIIRTGTRTAERSTGGEAEIIVLPPKRGVFGIYGAHPSSPYVDTIRDAIVFDGDYKELGSSKYGKKYEIIPLPDPATGELCATIKLGDMALHTPRAVIVSDRIDDAGNVVADEYGRPVQDVKNKDNDRPNTIPRVRMYDFLMRKFCEATIQAGHVTQYSVTFPLTDFIDAGIYDSNNSEPDKQKDVHAARKAFNDIMLGLEKYTLTGIVKSKNKQNAYELKDGDGTLKLFSWHTIHKGQCTVDRAVSFPWDEAIEQFVLKVPACIFDIKGPAYLLAYEAFVVLRRNAKNGPDPERKITLEYARFLMKIPDTDSKEAKTHPGRYKDRFGDAVTKIMDSFRDNGFRDVELELMFDTVRKEDYERRPARYQAAYDAYYSNSSVKDFIDRGYVAIRETVGGEANQDHKDIRGKKQNALTEGGRRSGKSTGNHTK